MFFNHEYSIDEEIGLMMREVANIDGHMRPNIEELYARFLAESADVEGWEATGFDFAATAEFTAWRKQVADVRNNLVHGTLHTVAKGEAAACFAAIHSAQEVIVAAASRAPWNPEQ